MNQKDKELLLKDLSARLPYGVIVQYKGHNNIPKDKILTGSDLDCNMEYYKPYLRPMLSMTKVEMHIYATMIRGYTIKQQVTLYDWLLKNHFDFRGLIEKGLAIEVTKENNPYKG